MNFEKTIITLLCTITVGVAFSIDAMDKDGNYFVEYKKQLRVNKKSSNNENYYFEEIYAELFHANIEIAQAVTFEKCAGESIIEVSKLLEDQYKAADFVEKNNSLADDMLNIVWQEYTNLNSAIYKTQNGFGISLQLRDTPKKPRKISGSGEYVNTPRPGGDGNKKESYHVPVLALYKLDEYLSRNEIEKAQGMLKDRNVMAYVEHYIPSHMVYPNQKAMEKFNNNMLKAKQLKCFST